MTQPLLQKDWVALPHSTPEELAYKMSLLATVVDHTNNCAGGAILDRDSKVKKWGLGRQLLGLAKAGYKFAKSGFVLLPQEQIDIRDGICRSNLCGHYIAARNKCDLCGCSRKKFKLKLSLPSEKCPDEPPHWLDLPTTDPEVKTWASGIITVPQRSEMLSTTMAGLEKAGFTNTTVFTDPVLEPSEWWKRSQMSLGWKNWYSALESLADKGTDAVVLFQDDILLCKGLNTFLSWDLWPAPVEEVGAVSLYCSSRYRDPKKGRVLEAGCDRLERSRELWGALALVFPLHSALRFLSDPKVHKMPGNRIDQRVRAYCRRHNLGLYIYSPSFVQHNGLVSTMGHPKDGAPPGPYMFADDFVGESTDLVQVLTSR